MKLEENWNVKNNDLCLAFSLPSLQNNNNGIISLLFHTYKKKQYTVYKYKKNEYKNLMVLK